MARTDEFKAPGTSEAAEKNISTAEKNVSAAEETVSSAEDKILGKGARAGIDEPKSRRAAESLEENIESAEEKALGKGARAGIDEPKARRTAESFEENIESAEEKALGKGARAGIDEPKARRAAESLEKNILSAQKGILSAQKDILGNGAVPGFEPLLQASNKLFEAWLAVSNELLEFGRNRLDRSIEINKAIAQSGNIKEALDLQTKYTHNAVQDYMSEVNKIADLSTRGLFDSFTPLRKAQASASTAITSQRSHAHHVEAAA